MRGTPATDALWWFFLATGVVLPLVAVTVIEVRETRARRRRIVRRMPTHGHVRTIDSQRLARRVSATRAGAR